MLYALHDRNCLRRANTFQWLKTPDAASKLILLESQQHEETSSNAEGSLGAAGHELLTSATGASTLHTSFNTGPHSVGCTSSGLSTCVSQTRENQPQVPWLPVLTHSDTSMLPGGHPCRCVLPAVSQQLNLEPQTPVEPHLGHYLASNSERTASSQPHVTTCHRLGVCQLQFTQIDLLHQQLIWEAAATLSITCGVGCCVDC